MTKPDTSTSSERVWLSRDGNAGCALLGVNLQEGEAEFVCIDDCPKDENGKPIHAGNNVYRWACTQALRKLEARLGRRLPYYWDNV